MTINGIPTVSEWSPAILADLADCSLSEAMAFMNDHPVVDGWSPESDTADTNLEAYARFWEEVGADDSRHPVLAEHADWRYDAAFPVESLLVLMGDREDWASWFRTECRNARDDGRFGYADLLLEPIVEPIVIVVTEDGTVDLWDGWHRLAASVIKGADTIRAVVGAPKPALVGMPQAS